MKLSRNSSRVPLAARLAQIFGGGQATLRAQRHCSQTSGDARQSNGVARDKECSRGESMALSKAIFARGVICAGGDSLQACADPVTPGSQDRAQRREQCAERHVGNGHR